MESGVSCWRKLYACTVKGCNEQYEEFSYGCKFNGHTNYDPKCDDWLNNTISKTKLDCPRHAGERWEDTPPTRKGPLGGYLVAITDAMTKEDRMNHFNRAEMSERPPVWENKEDQAVLKWSPDTHSNFQVAHRVNAVGGNNRSGADIQGRYNILIYWMLTGVMQLPSSAECPVSWPSWWTEESDQQLRELLKPVYVSYQSPEDRTNLLQEKALMLEFMYRTMIPSRPEVLAHRLLYILRRDQV